MDSSLKASCGVQYAEGTTLLQPEKPRAQTPVVASQSEQTSSTQEKSKNAPTEVLTSHAERFRMRLIRDFRLLENLNEMEQGLEAPKYHPKDIESPQRRSKILDENPYALVKFNSISKLKGIITKQERRWKRIKCRETTYPPLDMWANWVVESNWFQNFMLILIIVNAVLLIVDAELGETADPAYVNAVRIIRTCDYCCLWVFIMEIILKWIDDFKSFWKNGWNELDFYVTAVSVLPDLIRWFNSDVSGSGLMAGLSFLRVLRITRLLKMVSRFEQARIILMSVSKAFSAMSFILLLLALFMWMFALIGEVIFSKYTHYDGRAEGLHLLYQKAFSGILWSFATLFQLMTLDHWLETLLDLLKVMNGSYESTVTVIYILAWIWVGSFVFKNIFAGIMVNNFQTIRNDLHWEKKEKEAKNEVDKFKKEFTADLLLEEKGTPRGSIFEDSAKKLSNLPAITVEDNTSDSLQTPADLHTSFDDKRELSLPVRIVSTCSALSVWSQLSATSSIINKEPVGQEAIRAIKWENIIQRHMDLTATTSGETIWSRDVLFKFYQSMEMIEENMKERSDILYLLNLALLQIHDR